MANELQRNQDDEQARQTARRLLAQRGFRLRDVAQRAGVTPACVSQVFRRRYPRIERTIAAMTGVPAEKIWPHRHPNAD